MENDLKNLIAELKAEILQSRYAAAKLVNKEQLLLYFKIGEHISSELREAAWGSKPLQQISNQLQLEFPGLRGFSAGNLKKMRQFYQAYFLLFTISPSVTGQIQVGHSSIRSSVTNGTKMEQKPISPSMTDQLIISFFAISFTHHYEIISKCKIQEERFFYIEKTAAEFLGVRLLKSHIANKLFYQQGTLPNNFKGTLPKEYHKKAIQTFKDEYLLDFINIQDEDDEWDEKELEKGIVNNIKKFMMSLGNDFTFLGNQYRLIVDEQEFFIDLLFFNRKLQCLVGIELKKGKFKPEYLGKMNFYLSALDDLVKQPFENPSIGIILCREKNNKIVEYSFKDMDKAMGVATFKTTDKLPPQYAGVLPNVESLKKLLD